MQYKPKLSNYQEELFMMRVYGIYDLVVLDYSFEIDLTS